jgi:hAT family C-terminal dimerisation region
MTEATEPGKSSLDTNTVALAPGLMQFKHLAKKMKLDNSLQPQTLSAAGLSTIDDVKNIQNEIDRYIAEVVRPPTEPDALTFWANRHSSYPYLAPLAEDCIASPASQAFVERIFSVTGWLSVGKRNRLTKSLQMRVFMKLNSKLLQ